MDMTFNGAPNKPSETPPPSPDPSLASLERPKSGCCAQRFSPNRRFLFHKVISTSRGRPHHSDCVLSSVDRSFLSVYFRAGAHCHYLLDAFHV